MVGGHKKEKYFRLIGIKTIRSLAILWPLNITGNLKLPNFCLQEGVMYPSLGALGMPITAKVI
jgi:hypothetical protein